MSAPLLSIVVPTLNRRPLLGITLEALTREIQDFEDIVELVVVNNASDDDTDEFIATWAQGKRVRTRSFHERVNIDDSFQRCVDAAQGRYINIFGDDDLPLPGLVRHLVTLLHEHPDVPVLYLNRLIGNEDLSVVSEIAHPRDGMESRAIPTSVLIRTFTHWPSFITSLVFTRECWNRGQAFSRNEFLGYKFLARLYAGSANSSWLYVGMPLLVQRRGKQSWKADWPRYWLVNMPRILQTLEEAQITEGALEAWRRNDVSTKRLAVDCIVAKAYRYGVRDPFWAELRRYQPPLRAALAWFIQLLVPGAMARAAYFGFGKYGGRSSG